MLSPVFSPVLPVLLWVVKQDSDDIEEAAQHLQSKVEHSHSQTCNGNQKEIDTECCKSQKTQRHIIVFYELLFTPFQNILALPVNKNKKTESKFVMLLSQNFTLKIAEIQLFRIIPFIY